MAQANIIVKLDVQEVSLMASGCGTAGRAAAADTWDPKFAPLHRLFFKSHFQLERRDQNEVKSANVTFARKSSYSGLQCLRQDGRLWCLMPGGSRVQSLPLFSLQYVILNCSYSLHSVEQEMSWEKYKLELVSKTFSQAYVYLLRHFLTFNVGNGCVHLKAL